MRRFKSRLSLYLDGIIIMVKGKEILTELEEKEEKNEFQLPKEAKKVKKLLIVNKEKKVEEHDI